MHLCTFYPSDECSIVYVECLLMAVFVCNLVVTLR